MTPTRTVQSSILVKTLRPKELCRINLAKSTTLDLCTAVKASKVGLETIRVIAFHLIRLVEQH